MFPSDPVGNLGIMATGAFKPDDLTPLEEALVDVARLGLRGDVRSLRQRTRNLLRDGKDAPLTDAARRYLGQLLAAEEPLAPIRRGRANSAPRTVTPAPPISEGSTLPLLTVEAVDDAQMPQLPPAVSTALARIVAERRQADRLDRLGVGPTASLLLVGPPGVGKSMIARWLAREVDLPLVRIEAAGVMSSLFGQSARNLQQVLRDATASPSLVLLDEFDAYARRRDDHNDIGEPKRFVNALLLELDRWSTANLLVAATNHFDLVDPAMGRRFDVVLEIPLPTFDTRRAIVADGIARAGHAADDRLLDAVAFATEGQTGSDLIARVRAALRASALDETPIEHALAEALIAGQLQGRGREATSARVRFTEFAAGSLGLSQREIARLAGVSHVAIGQILRGRRAPLAEAPV